MREALRARLECPRCRGELDSVNGLTCRSCGSEYDVVDGVPNLMPPEPPGGTAWSQKQEAGLREYEAHELRDSSFSDSVARTFAEFAALRGLVIDVGCGIEPTPAYHVATGATEYVGVDPLESSEPRAFEFVRGVGERIPFKDESFDGAVLATMLDHVSDPSAVLVEVRRVVRPGGDIAIWVGVLDTERVRRIAQAPYAVPSLEASHWRRFLAKGPRAILRGAWRHLVVNRVAGLRTRLELRLRRRAVVDRVYPDHAEHHFRFFEEAEVVQLVKRVGLEIVRTRRLADAAHGDSLFVVAHRS